MNFIFCYFLGIPEEELLRQQQELFARAREAAVMQEQQQLAEVHILISVVDPFHEADPDS